MIEDSEGEEDQFVCLACQALHFQAIFSSRRTLHIHFARSKYSQCSQEWKKIKVMIRPGCVVAQAGGACGMGPCPPPQHQLPGGA